MTFRDHLWQIVGSMVANPMNVLGAFLLAMVTVILYRAQHDEKNKIDLTYLLVDSTVGNVTLAKFAGFGAFVASTWVLVDLAVTGKFDSSYAIFYTAIWSGAKVASDYLTSHTERRDA